MYLLISLNVQYDMYNLVIVFYLGVYVLISLNVQYDMYNLVIVFLTWCVSADKFKCAV